MKLVSARAGIGVAAVLAIALNAAVVVARTDDRAVTVAAGRGSARSASVGAETLPEDEPATTTTTSVAAPVDRTTTTTAAPAPTTTTTVRTTSTTVKADPGGVVGRGLYVMAADGSGVRRLSAASGIYSWAPDGSRLAYAGGGELTVLRADGSGRSTVAAAGQGVLGPVWSPDGRRIAFGRSGGGTFVVPADGPGPATLIDPAGQFADWTPAGELIVLTAPGSGLASILAYDLAGGRRVLATDASTFIQPAPSPDGRLVAYQGEGLRVAAVDGSGSRPLTGPCCADLWVASPLRWSADGRQLAYTNRGNVEVIGADGTGARVAAKGAVAPAWAPDGRQLGVIDQGTVGAGGKYRWMVQVVPVGGGERRTIFDPGPGFQAITPQWSPDGRWLAVRVT